MKKCLLTFIFALYPILKFQQWQNPRSCISIWFSIGGIDVPPSKYPWLYNTNTWKMGNGWVTSAICIGTWTSEAQILQHVHCSTCNHFRTFDFQYMHVLEQNQHIWNPAGKLPSPLVCLIYYVCIVLPHEPTRGLRKTHVVSQGVWIRTMRNVHCQGFYALVITILSVLHQKLPWK